MEHIDKESQLVYPGNKPEFREKRLDSGMVSLFVDEIIEKHAEPTAIILPYNNIGDDGVSALCKLIESSTVLHTIDLRYNDFSANGAQELASALSTNASVKKVILSGNPIEDGICMAELLQNNATITELYLSNTSIKTDAMIGIATVMKENNTLEVLHLDNPRLHSIGDDVILHFSEMLRVNSSIRILKMSKCGFCDSGIALLVKHLQENTTLEDLDLSCNKIGTSGLESLSALLYCGSNIKRLVLDCNRLGDNGAFALTKALPESKLEYLSVVKCSFEDEGLLSLAGSCASASKLKVLKLWGNRFGPRSNAAFHKLFESRFKYSGIKTDFVTYVVDGTPRMAQKDAGC
eukprot:TRINITY_DN780050_c0_g1_i1.p1 TRINITY_DN780050_c0_g1~~TRINITY_DN780050_c0_g1_i1.p1  ORF type:complete len:349 (+),score=76.19 TRINITY_DN780050_c0_g1_i1:43-1089(+)